MRIGLITTLDTNIGDDFIRVGVCRLLDEVFKGQTIEYVPVNKHRPLTVYPRLHPIHLARHWRWLPRGGGRLQRYTERAASWLQGSRFSSCDLIVQCGAPVIWKECWETEWAEPLWHRVIGPLSRQGVPVLNLGAGSCFAWERQPESIDDPKDVAYLKSLLRYCRLTTARGSLGQKLFQSVGGECPLLPCPALLAGQSFVQPQPTRELALINYMHRGGHYDWDQNIDADAWQRTVRAFVAANRQRHRIAFVCHNREEYKLAASIAPDLPRHLPTTPRQYFELVAQAKIALCNRLHAAVGLAGLGIPSVSVGTDTRLFMLHALKLPCFYVKDATLNRVQGAFDRLLSSLPKEEERLNRLVDITFAQYVELIRRTLGLVTERNGVPASEGSRNGHGGTESHYHASPAPFLNRKTAGSSRQKTALGAESSAWACQNPFTPF
jgi:hypothetical protein